MAVEAGFPWQAPSRDPEKTEMVLPESTNVPPPHSIKQEAEPTSPTKTAAPHQHSQLWKNSNSQGKHRHGSAKGPLRTGITTAFNTPSESARAKLTSPLPVRTIPPWVRDADEDDLSDPQFQSPDTPHAALVAQHHHSPSTARRALVSSRQSQEEDYSTPSGKARAPRTSRWMSFAQPSAYPRENFNSEKVDPDWLNQNFTDYSKTWLADHDDDDVEDGSSRYRAFRRKRQVWYKRAQFYILRNPFIPLAFRLTVLSFAIVALGLGASIYHETGKITECIKQAPERRSAECTQRVGPTATDYYRDPSGLMAVIVDAIAIGYTVYITYDEYFSKPLGLRRARAKVRLMLLDLFFIVFQSANLSLSFESLTVDEGACKTGDSARTTGRFESICDRAEALSGVLLVSLTAWLMTFSVSVLRQVYPYRPL
ncbi:uncharacterized protein Z520_04182 [Fonsecaea multimorphosa CBS 102226]|uniref:Uncharacterized protein n=1 Tax=Fonsecaea multimorphosa CBS 102226 TaxID=1442371 RepID=A0A0D2IU33_9EURO|nr:uncharacterized protein Z520_04182 [Fonsecaea multimorphosa CBS 102226]KIY00497.1 hypothetical protein Z520_04182 [Fonsecaea multimorphosa CBS 102226]OAL27011.1 hypothetical protein AYO22_03955 [Fonsecaea multimorphosa]